MIAVQKLKFSDLDINDTFFNSFKELYPDFVDWFNNHENSNCYVVLNNNQLTDLLYLKTEIDDFDTYITPQFNENILKLKIGILKCNTKGVSHLYMYKIFQKAIKNKIKFIYVTFYKNDILIRFLENYGFRYWGKKGDELVYIFGK